MSETVDIKINLSSEHWDDRYPGARVYINQELIHEGLIAEPTELSWSGELEEGEQVIVVEMYDKRNGDTVQDDNGNIIKDVILNIDNISFDDVDLARSTTNFDFDLDYVVLQMVSTYYPKSEYAPEVLDRCVNLGWNGRWELKFSSPTYLWLLENL